MTDDSELKINARGLSAPGPRLMVQTALAKSQSSTVRVVVSTMEAAEDVKSFLEQRGATALIDTVGEEYHVKAQLKA